MSVRKRDKRTQAFMAQALALAQESERITHPNPRVGCVIVRDERVISSGVTSDIPGGPHAEIEALKAARAVGADLAGADVFVTLEPCCHYGRTPPCSDALKAAGVARVIGAMRDPNPRVAGGGFAALERAGIETALGDEQAELHARQINAGFFSRIERSRPWLRLKLAASLDGRTAMASGESQWITGSEARADVQRYRARADAILTGIGTVLADDPRLNVRLQTDEGRERQPLRVVMDSTLRTPTTAKLFECPGDVLVAFAESADSATHASVSAAADALVERGAGVIALGGGQRVDPDALLAHLAGLEINEVHTECGAMLAGSLIEADLVDELVVYLAPRLIGAGGWPMLSGSGSLAGTGRLIDAPRLAVSDIVRIGEDIRITLAKA